MTYLEPARRVHFVGAGGIGMSALARHLISRGYQVSGSDAAPGDQIDALAALGAKVYVGHAAQQVDGADLVVVTSAAPADNPEVLEARARGIPIIKRAVLLAEIANAGRGIAVAGTHGKSTTSALIGHILTEAGGDPTILIGGISANLGSNARAGKSDLVVVEADEYDASFLRLEPEVAVITNVEPDHLDFYGSEQAVREAFRRFASQVRGALIICADDPVLPGLASEFAVPIVSYGLTEGDWRASDIREGDTKTIFTVSRPVALLGCEMVLAGNHNVLNALGAMAACSTLGVCDEALTRGLATFRGVARRFEIKGEARGVLVIDDYAHHPTEIRVNLEAVKRRFNRPVRLVFQPHTYSRTKAFLSDFAASFPGADTLYLLDVYAARETDTLGVSGAHLAAAASLSHPDVRYTESIPRTVQQLAQDVRPGDLVITMGAGDVYRVATDLLERLAA